MARRLAGKICLISGVGRGIGQETALVFCGEGATVVGCDIDPISAQKTACAAREAGGTMVVMDDKLDLTLPAGCKRFVKFGEDEFGGIDVLFNNAGKMWGAYMDEMTPEVWDNCIRDELDIAFYLCLTVWPAMIRRGGGSIINVGSVAGQKPSPNVGNVAHMAAKAGVIAMSQQMALEGGRHGIRVNSVSPGPISTPQSAQFINDPIWVRVTAPLRILGRHGTPRDIANYVLFLASDESSYVTGTDLLVDGGASIGSTVSSRFTPQSMPG
jgi:NAD(P)-dependent dehydrogenase (short-subunit alcohol dehydrogenase family)